MGEILAVFGDWWSGVQKLSIFTPKGTSLPESVSFKPFCATIGWGVWPPGVLLKKGESHRSSHWNDVSPLTQGCTPVRLWLFTSQVPSVCFLEWNIYSIFQCLTDVSTPCRQCMQYFTENYCIINNANVQIFALRQVGNKNMSATFQKQQT